MPRKTTLNNTKETKDTRINGVPKYRLGGLAPTGEGEKDPEAKSRNDEAVKATNLASANAAVNTAYGAGKAMEGIRDFLKYAPKQVGSFIREGAYNGLTDLADLVGWDRLGDYFNSLVQYEQNRQDSIQKKIDHDIVGDIMGKDAEGEGYFDWQWANNLSKRTSEAVGEDANRVLEEISQGVGGMLPIVAVSIATAGTGAAVAGGAAAGSSAAGAAAANAGLKALQTGLFFAQVAGQATESAGKRGATPKAAFVYGLASGAVEAGTEWLGGTVFGEATGGVAGKILDKISPGVTNKILASTGGRILWTFTNEGVEEIFSDLAQPLLDAGAGIGDLSKETWKETIKGLPETFAIGGTVGILLEGLTSGISNVQNRAKGGSHYNASIRSMQTIANAIQANEAVKASSTSTQQRVNKMETATSKLILNEMQKISNEMQKMTAEQRATLLADAPVLNVYLTEDGHVREDIAANLKSQISSGTASNTSETIFDANAEAANLAQVAQQVGQSVKVDTSELNATERKNFAELLKANQTWNETSGTNTRVVIYTGASESIKAFVAPKIIDNTVYISRESLSKGEAIQKYLHENFGHLSPVTADTEILSELGSNEQLKERAMQDLLQNDNSQGYDRTDLEDLIDRALANEELTDEEAGVFEEYAARLYEFGLDKGSIERIARKNPKGLAKLGSAIKARIEQKKMLNLSDAERSRLQSLRRAERLISQKAEAFSTAKQTVAAKVAQAQERYFEDRAEYLSLDEKDRAAWLKEHGYEVEDFAPGVLGENEDVSTLPKEYREEYLAASKETEQAETKKAAEAGELQGDIPKITLSSDTELSERLSGLRGAKRYKALENFLMEKFQDHEFTLSDGLKAIMTRSDADELSHGAEEMRTAELANLADIVERAVFVSSADHVTHSKFSSFRYYAAEVSFGSESDKILLNIGKGKFDHKNHIYAITGYNEKRTAGRASLGLPGSVDDRVKSGSSNNSIPQNSDLSTPKSEKSDVKFSRVTPAQNEEKSDVRFPKVESSQSEAKKAENGLRKQLEQWIAGDYRKSFFNAGETPLALTRFGAAKGDLIIYEDCIRKVTGGKHSIAIEELAKIPSELADPILLFKGSVENSFVALTEMKDKQGNDVIVAIHLNKQKGRFAINKIASVYSKSDDFGNNKIVPYVFNQIQKGNLVDASYKKASNWFMSRGLQLPKQVQTILDAYNTSIPQNSDLSTETEKKVKFSKIAPDKQYTRTEADNVIGTVLSERLAIGKADPELLEVGKAIIADDITEQAAHKLYQNLSKLTGPKERQTAALRLADYVVENAIVSELWNLEKPSDDVLDRSRAILSLMEEAKGHLIFGENQKSFVDATSYGAVSAFRSKGKNGFSMEQFAARFEEIGITLSSDDPIEIFRESLALQQGANDEVLATTGCIRMAKYLNADKVKSLKSDIAKDFLRAYDENGVPSKLKKKLDSLRAELKTARQETAAERKIAKVRLSVLRDLRFLRAATNRTYAEKNNIPISANLPSNPAFKGLAKDVASVMRGDNISPQKTREMMVAVGDHLTKGNEIYSEWLEAIGDEKKSPIRQYVAEDLANITSVDVLREADGAFSKEDLTLDEWQAFSKLVKLVKTVYTKYDNFYEDGKRYNLTEATTRYQEITHFVIDSRSTDERAFWRMIGEAEDAYSRAFCTPQVFCERADGYNKDGFYSHYLARFTIDTLNMEIKKAQAMEKLEAFAKKHKRFDKRLKERIAYDGAAGRKISVGEAMDIWLMSTQDNGFLTLTEERGGGVNCSDERGMDTIKGLKFTKESLDALYQSFTAEDREFIEIIKEGYKSVGELRKDANLRMYGFNYDVFGDYYWLIRDQRNQKKDLDASASSRMIETTGNNAINKARREKAMVIPLQASDVLEKFNRRLNIVSKVWALGEDMQNFKRIYNKDLSPVLNGTQTMRNLLNDLYPTKIAKGETIGEGEKYIEKLYNDIQGVGSKRTTASEITRRLRSGYATAVLGLNLGVSASQLASIPNALPYIDFDVMLKAFGSMRRTEGATAMDQYSKTALVRSLDKGVVRSEGLVDKVGKVADKTTFLIQKSDRAAITFLWKCAQLQVAKTQGLAVGTEENLKAAGQLLDQINTETQPTYQATDRSLFQRSEHELVKSLAMFQSVPTKQRSMIISAIGEAKALGAQVKYVQKQLQSGNLSTEQKAQYTEQLKDLQERKQQSKPKVARAISGVILAQAVYAAVRMGVGRLLHQKDDEPVGEDFLERTKDAMISIFPIFKELYEGLIKGNELEETTLSMVNNLITGVKPIYDADNPEQRNKALLNLGYNAFMIFGLPAKNVRNIIVGAIKYSPDAYDRLEEPFQVATTKKMTTALDRGDYDFAADLAVRIMADKGLDISKEQGRLLADLYSKNYSLPSGTITQYTIDGTTYTLTDAEKANFSLVYGDAGAAADELIGKSGFAKLSDSGKNKAISTLYSYYRDKAKTETVGIDASKLYLMGTAVGADTLALILAQIQDLLDKAKASGKDYNRKELITAFLKRQDLTAVQKYMVMGYLGYKNKTGAEQVAAYINRLKLTKKEKQALYEASGYGK